MRNYTIYSSLSGVVMYVVNVQILPKNQLGDEAKKSAVLAKKNRVDIHVFLTAWIQLSDKFHYIHTNVPWMHHTSS